MIRVNASTVDKIKERYLAADYNGVIESLAELSGKIQTG